MVGLGAGPQAMSLTIDVHLDDAGRPIATTAAPTTGGLAIAVDGAVIGVVPEAAAIVVLRRYGRPLEPEVVALVAPPALHLAAGATVAHLRWRAAVDAAPRDWDRPGRARPRAGGGAVAGGRRGPAPPGQPRSLIAAVADRRGR
jgi:hypothetical protein